MYKKLFAVMLAGFTFSLIGNRKRLEETQKKREDFLRFLKEKEETKKDH